MKLADLLEYVMRNYRIEENYRWPEFPGFSVIAHPETGSWAALLMRRQDPDTGEILESCDMKCGLRTLQELRKPYLFPPVRMKGEKWINVVFDSRTEPETVNRLFDQAFYNCAKPGYTMVLEGTKTGQSGYQDTPLPFQQNGWKPHRDVLPEKIVQLRRMFRSVSGTAKERNKNFVTQARFMEDYEDDYPWTGEIDRFYPVYQHLRPEQLRGYFSWRTKVRKGEIQEIPHTAMYLYIFELINGIGVASKEDCLKKLKEFEEMYLLARLDRRDGKDDFQNGNIVYNLRKWRTDLCVLFHVSKETALLYADPSLMEHDHMLAVLREPDRESDESVVHAISEMEPKISRSIVMQKEGERAVHLFAEIWRRIVSLSREKGSDFFEKCFGKLHSYPWFPLSSAVYYMETPMEDTVYRLTPCRTCSAVRGRWYMESYEKHRYDLSCFKAAVHEADLQLRLYLGTGRKLKPAETDPVVKAAIEAVLFQDQREKEEASRKKIKINLLELDQIRKDAIHTRDSLLSEEEKAELRIEEAGKEDKIEAEKTETGKQTDAEQQYAEALGADLNLPLDPVHTEILRRLLLGMDVRAWMNANHILPSIAADTINEALMDELGDTAVSCQEDELMLVEDYRQEIEELFGGEEG